MRANAIFSDEIRGENEGIKKNKTCPEFAITATTSLGFNTFWSMEMANAVYVEDVEILLTREFHS